MVLRPTLDRIAQICCWLFVGALCLVAVAAGSMYYIHATTPWYPGCDGYECKGEASRPLHLNAVGPAAGLPPSGTSSREQNRMYDGEGGGELGVD